jgi:mannose-1-phosphate guanylyltransferase
MRRGPPQHGPDGFGVSPGHLGAYGRTTPAGGIDAECCERSKRPSRRVRGGLSALMDWLVILAGGRGERFWPLSRQTRPKQFLRLLSDRTMLQETVDRVGPHDPTRIVVVTGRDYLPLVREQLPAVPDENVLGEPVGRNTAASVAWATRVILDRDPEALLTVLPSDHAIGRPERFREALALARDHAGATGRFTLFGIVPNRPDTGFGYIEAGPEAANSPVRPVVRFVEKPDRERARAMVESGRYFWNAGMFILPAGRLWHAFQQLMPALAAGIQRVVARPVDIEGVFQGLESVSLDVGIMERADALSVLPADIGWDDVGTFQAVARLLAERAPERVVFDRADDVVVIGDDGPWVAGVGVRHLVIVRTPDVVLVLTPEEAQGVRNLVNQLKDGPGRQLL